MGEMLMTTAEIASAYASENTSDIQQLKRRIDMMEQDIKRLEHHVQKLENKPMVHKRR